MGEFLSQLSCLFFISHFLNFQTKQKLNPKFFIDKMSTTKSSIKSDIVTNIFEANHENCQIDKYCSIFCCCLQIPVAQCFLITCQYNNYVLYFSFGL